jgi:YHS domain-containing protein
MIKYAVLLCFLIGVNLNILAQDTSKSQDNSKNQNNSQIQGNTQDQGNTKNQRNTQTQGNTQNQSNAQAEGNNTQNQEQYQSFNSVCPVDGQQVDPSVKPIRYKGKEYGFDSPSCALVFSDNPELYAGNLTDKGEKYTHHDLEPENRKGIENEAQQDNEEK